MTFWKKFPMVQTRNLLPSKRYIYARSTDDFLIDKELAPVHIKKFDTLLEYRKLNDTFINRSNNLFHFKFRNNYRMHKATRKQCFHALSVFPFEGVGWVG